MKRNRPLFFLALGIFVLWSIYRYFFRFSEWIDEIVFKNAIMLLPVIYTVCFIERSTLASLGVTGKKFFLNCLIGLAAGLLLSGEAELTQRIKHGSLIFNPNHLHPSGIIYLLLLSLITAFIEESVYRGYFLTRLQKSLNTSISNILSSLFFTSVHLPLFIFVNHYSPFDIITAMLMIFILGIINGLIFIKTKSLAGPVLTHAIWNISTQIFL